MAASLTVMFPYTQIDPEAAFSAAFQAKGANYAMYIVTIGALIGMMNSLVSISSKNMLDEVKLIQRNPSIVGKLVFTIFLQD